MKTRSVKELQLKSNIPVTDFSLPFLIKYFYQKKIGGEEGMTQKEYNQACEIERLKKKIQEKDNKIKDLEIEKKHSNRN